MTKLFLGVDGGQSSTTALAGDETGRVLGVGRGGPCNHVGAAEGRAKFLSAVGGCVREALAQAGVADARFEAACLGFSGGPADKDALTREIVHADRYSITNDGLIALVGATAGAPGIITIAGTGSFAFGRNAAERSARGGGWGYVFGDEGSGFDIARQALRAALRHEEGWGPETSLRAVLMEATGARDADDVLHRFYTDEYPRARVATFARLVDQAAINGDTVARDILNAGAQSLAVFAGAVRAQLFKPGEIANVSYTGGAFRSAIVRERFRLLMELEEANRVAPPVYGPAAGALIEAYRIAGVSCRIEGAPKEKEPE